MLAGGKGPGAQKTQGAKDIGVKDWDKKTGGKRWGGGIRPGGGPTVNQSNIVENRMENRV